MSAILNLQYQEKQEYKTDIVKKLQRKYNKLLKKLFLLTKMQKYVNKKLCNFVFYKNRTQETAIHFKFKLSKQPGMDKYL